MCEEAEAHVAHDFDASDAQADAAEEVLTVKPIGYVRSSFTEYGDVPHGHGKKGWSDRSAQVVLLPEHAEGLQGLEGFSHVIIVFWLHKAEHWSMPKRHPKPEWVKVFATRMPRRPNPIGVSVVELSDFSPETGALNVKGLDCLDGTPVLDVKPYIADLDAHPEATIPSWVLAKRAGLDPHSRGPG